MNALYTLFIHWRAFLESLELLIENSQYQSVCGPLIHDPPNVDAWLPYAYEFKTHRIVYYLRLLFRQRILFLFRIFFRIVWQDKRGRSRVTVIVPFPELSNAQLEKFLLENQKKIRSLINEQYLKIKNLKTELGFITATKSKETRDNIMKWGIFKI